MLFLHGCSSISHRPSRFLTCPPFIASPMISSEGDFLRRIKFTHQFLESGISSLDDDQSENVVTYCKLFLDTALVSVSSASYYRITKVRKFLRKMNTQLGPTMLVLCMLFYVPLYQAMSTQSEYYLPRASAMEQGEPRKQRPECFHNRDIRAALSEVITG